jgi:hypothetical protein
VQIMPYISLGSRVREPHVRASTQDPQGCALLGSCPRGAGHGGGAGLPRRAGRLAVRLYAWPRRLVSLYARRFILVCDGKPLMECADVENASFVAAQAESLHYSG